MSVPPATTPCPSHWRADDESPTADPTHWVFAQRRDLNRLDLTAWQCFTVPGAVRYESNVSIYASPNPRCYVLGVCLWQPLPISYCTPAKRGWQNLSPRVLLSICLLESFGTGVRVLIERVTCQFESKHLVAVICDEGYLIGKRSYTSQGLCCIFIPYFSATQEGDVASAKTECSGI